MINKLSARIFTSIFALALLFAPLHSVGATAAQQAACQGSGGRWTGTACVSSNPNDTRTVTSTIRQVANILIFIVGAIAVIMIIIGAIRYTIAQGDQNAITSAKNTIIYALVGIVVAVSAYGIVTFVTNSLR